MFSWDKLPSSLISSSLYHIVKNKNTSYEDIVGTFNEKYKKIDNPETDYINNCKGIDLTKNLNS